LTNFEFSENGRSKAMLCLGSCMTFYQCFAHLWSDMDTIRCLTYVHNVFEPLKNSMRVGAGKAILSLWA